jgi:hypothetical protein
MLRWSNFFLVSLVVVMVHAYKEENVQPKPSLLWAVGWGGGTWVMIRRWEDKKAKA